MQGELQFVLEWKGCAVWFKSSRWLFIAFWNIKIRTVQHIQYKSWLWYNNYSSPFDTLNRPKLSLKQLRPGHYRRYSKLNCWGPIDGTVRHAHIQRMVYIGDKRVHDLKFQSIMATNEMFTFFFSLSTAILQNVWIRL